MNDIKVQDAGYTGSDAEKSNSNDQPADLHIRGFETAADFQLHKGLKSRHITMIAIGGAIGTGLIIGTGRALANSGPGSLLIGYAFMGFLVWIVMCAVGEMAAWLPMSAGFSGYATRYCHPSLGFALGWV